MMQSLHFPSTAPLADAFEVDDFLLDDAEQYCNFQITDSINAALTRGSELPDANRTDEEEMEQDGMEMLANVINDSSSEDDDELNRDDEYPEFVRTCGESVVETESYDFAVMDTEEDMDSTKRKRKTDNSMACKKKRVG